jgi:23S rRNA pseudouridine2605 synthase
MTGKKAKPQPKQAPRRKVGPRPMGLARVLQKAGYGTRAKTTEIVLAGRVMVKGEVVKDPAFMVEPGTEILLDRKPMTKVVPTYFVFHKPARVVCAKSDGPERKKVADFLPPDVPGLTTAGRMDGKTTGMLLVSNDSAWNNSVTGSEVLEQEYRIQVEGELTELEISVITAGIHMPNLGVFKPASVKIVEKLNGRTVILMVTRGTKARMVRRMFNTLRHKITLLRRIRIGEIRLGNLPSGGVRQLNDQEVRSILSLASAENPNRPNPA